MMEHILTYTIFSPLIGLLIILFVPRRFEEGVRAVALFTSLLTLALSLVLFFAFKAGTGYQFQEARHWIPALNINYHLGIDGVSLLLICLTTLLVTLCVVASWNEITKRRKEFYSLMLVCEIGLLGAFSALDLFLFYVFWELMLIPMYFMIGIWGSGNRVYVALKLLLYTMIGSLFMLVGIIYLYIKSGNSFDMLVLGKIVLDPQVQLWLFLSFAFAFAIKVPIFPFHTWLPDAHTESPTAGSVLLAGVFLKVGAYGFYRIAMPYFPDAVVLLRPYIFTLAVIGIVYGALLSIVQTDLKRLIAYSSVSHMGFVILGLISLNPEGVSGAVLQMVNHGLSTGALFLLFGMLYYRSHTRKISDYGGIGKTMPIFAGIFIFTGLSSLGLPGLNNFVGEVLTLIGAFKARPVMAIISATGVIFAAVYILLALERVFYGEKKTFKTAMKDINAREVALISPLLIMIVWLGVYPGTALSKITESTTDFLNMSRRSIADVVREPLETITPQPRTSDIEIIMPESLPDVDEMKDEDKETEGVDRYEVINRDLMKRKALEEEKAKEEESSDDEEGELSEDESDDSFEDY